MLIRFVINNIFSFGSQKEFTLIPNNRLKTLVEHNYQYNDFQILKMASIYGANGAGKSNLIKALSLFKRIITAEGNIRFIKNNEFKFHSKDVNKPQLFAIEFIQDDVPFYYAVEIYENVIKTEELYVSGLGLNEDKLIYERKTDLNNITQIRFLSDFEKDAKSKILKDVLLEDFVKPNELILKLISNRDNEYLQVAKKAYKWFSDTLKIIMPDSQPMALVQRMESDSHFKAYAENIMCSFNVGITAITSEKKEIRDFFGEENENEIHQLIKSVEESKTGMLGLKSRRGDEIIVLKEGDGVYVKKLKLEHKGENDITVEFDLDEESDGTIRLLDFVPAFYDLVSNKNVYIIDEIERSIHPLIIKEIVSKFSKDESTKGQLIFSTHESNLLDQEIFRTDEIWFTEKSVLGSTKLYSLSDFKEHNTIDIRKGYLNGRYGAIPFLGNLQDLNWHKFQDEKE